MIEMLVVLIILAVLAAIAAPNMGQMIRTQRVKTASFDVFSTLTLARGEAIKRNVSVTITPTDGNWAHGWTITDAYANVVRTQASYSNVTISGPGTVVYTGSGRITGGVPPQFSLSASDVASFNQRCIRVDLSGRPVSMEGACA